MTTDDLNTLRDEVAVVLEAAARDNSKGRYPESWVEFADALLPLLARRIEAARAEAAASNSDIAADLAAGDETAWGAAVGAAYHRGLAEGGARVRARVEAVLDRLAVALGGIAAARYQMDLRAALAEPTGREGEQ